MNASPSHHLSEQQLADFDSQGFVVLPGFVSTADVEALRTRAGEIIEEFDPTDASVFDTVDQRHADDEYFLSSGGVVRCFLEDDGATVNKIGHALHDLDPTFEAFSYSARLAALAAQLRFTEPQLLQSMYILKAPHVGGEVVPHIDHTFLWTDPQSATAFWFAIDDATVDNGCMWAVPGGHRTPARTRFRREGTGTVMDTLHDEPWPTDGWVPLEAAAGTLIIMHGQLPHKSEHNHSDRRRHAFTLHMIDGAATYAEDNWLQRGPDLPLRPLQPQQ